MNKRVGALVLAAGFSHRFGSIKLCARLDNGNTVFAQTLQRLKAATSDVLVITRPELAQSLIVHADSLQVFDDAGKGMGATLAYGIGMAECWDACLICLADMPFIAGDTYAELRGLGDSDTIIVPHYQNQPGNPVVFGRKFYPELMQLSGDSGGRAVLNKHRDRVIAHAVSDPAILHDIDTPDDLARLQFVQE